VLAHIHDGVMTDAHRLLNFPTAAERIAEQSARVQRALALLDAERVYLQHLVEAAMDAPGVSTEIDLLALADGPVH
jgi:hypothetical protein